MTGDTLSHTAAGQRTHKRRPEPQMTSLMGGVVTFSVF